MPPVIDGKRWIDERLKFLRERLGADPSDEERQSIETEIEALVAERRKTVPGFPRGFPRFPGRRKSGS
ncbi:MAG: hypothetical protein M3357_12630 [Actinomycetota bacterium]|nr:hypothetical protein [Actinomycetota bacterium]